VVDGGHVGKAKTASVDGGSHTAYDDVQRLDAPQRFLDPATPFREAPMFDRRDFLKRTSAAALAAAPYFWTSRRAGAAESKNGRLNVGAIGVGGRGSQIALWASELGNMVACCDVDRTHAERFAGAFEGKCAIHGDYRELIERDDVDVVTVGTPDHWHVKIAIEAMKAGLDVYCEKPVSLTIDEGKVMCRAVEETGRVVQVGSDQRSDRRILRGIALARSGRLGKTLTARVGLPRYLTGGPFPTMEPPGHLDWNVWLGPAASVPYCPERCHGLFRMWREYSGGSLTDWGAHHVDVAMWGLGQSETGPVEVEGEGTVPDVPNGYNIAVDYHVTLTFADGSKMVVSDDRDRGVLFEGEEGRFFVNRNRLSGKPVEELTDADRRWLAEESDKLSGLRDLPEVGGDTWQTRYMQTISRDHMRNFFDCVKSRKTPASDMVSHHRVLNCCHLCNIAIRLKRKLKWDPAEEKFLGDDEANGMLRREQRAAYAIEG
jgi:predicted dehydrogenase